MKLLFMICLYKHNHSYLKSKFTFPVLGYIKSVTLKER